MTVAHLLGESRRAHLEYRAAFRDHRVQDMKAALSRALDTRQRAQDSDPQFTDPAWHEDTRGGFGIIAPSPMTDRELHADLLTFYTESLARP